MRAAVAVKAAAAGEQNWSPLHLAGMRGHTAAVEFLVKRGANHKAKVREGNGVAVEVIRFRVIFYSLSLLRIQDYSLYC